MTMIGVDDYGDGHDGFNDFGHTDDVTVTLVMALMMMMTLMMAMVVTKT